MRYHTPSGNVTPNSTTSKINPEMMMMSSLLSSDDDNDFSDSGYESRRARKNK